MANEIEDAALEAIRLARVDGESKYGLDSWKEETIANQLRHASDHMHAVDVNGDAWETEHDLEHALCRLAIAVALKKQGLGLEA